MSSSRVASSLAIFLLIALWGEIDVASAATDVSGTISATTVWTPAGSPYRIAGPVYLVGGVTLTIEAGTVVKFATGESGLQVYGTLNAAGSGSSRVHFTSIRDDATGGDTNGDGGATSPAAGDWRGIEVQEGGSATLGYVSVRYGGNGTAAVSKNGAGRLEISRSIIRSSSSNGISIANSPGIHTVSENDISTSINLDGIVLIALTGEAAVSGNTITGARHGIYLINSSGTCTISGNTIVSGREKGILLQNGSGAIALSGNSITGNAGHGIESSNSTPSILGNTVTGNGGCGLFVTGSAVPTATAGNILTGNSGGPVTLTAESSDTAIADDNDFPGPIRIDTGSTTRSVVWSNSRDYYVLNHVYVCAGHSLTVRPGQVVKFREGDVSLQLYGTLIAVGSGEQRIHFTSIRDDAVGGDSNGDGGATVPAAGDWRGIELQEGGSATLDYVTVRYAGSLYANIYKFGSGAVSLDHAVVSDSRLHGVQFQSSSSPQAIGNSTVFANGLDGIYLGNTGTAVTVSASAISDNGRYGLAVLGGSPQIIGNIVRNHAAYPGIYLDSATPVIRGNTVSSNLIGIRSNGSAPQIGGSAGTGNTIAGNILLGVDAFGSTGAVPARFNWWGDGSGPYHPATNPGGRGNGVSNGVDYGDWLPAAALAIPVGRISPANHDFGSMVAGRSTEERSFAVANDGGADLVVSGFGTVGPDAPMFVPDAGTCGAAPFSVLPGTSCTLTVRFAPSGKNGRNGTLRIATNDAPLYSSLSGTGYFFRLDIGFGGTGTGIVTATPSPVVCNTPCSIESAADRTITLEPQRSTFSLFRGWSGACSGSGDICTVVMGGDRSAVARFDRDSEHSARIDRQSPAGIVHYPSITAAYNGAVSGETIKSWGTDFVENLVFGSPASNKSIVLKGGYDEGYTANSGMSIVRGTVTLVTGSVTIERVTVR